MNEYSDFAAQLLKGKKPNGSVPGPSNHPQPGQIMPPDPQGIGQGQHPHVNMHPEVLLHVSHYMNEKLKAMNGGGK